MSNRVRSRIFAGLRWLRPRPATLIAYLALMVAMSGVAYAAGTISSADILDNTVQSIDLKDGGAVKGVDVVDDSLTGVDIKESTLKGVARKLLYESPAVDPQVLTTLVKVGPYTLQASCANFGGTGLRLWANDPAGTADESSTETNNQTNPASESGQLDVTRGILLPQGLSQVVSLVQYGPYYHRLAGTMMIRSGTTLVQVDIQAVADNRGPSCWLRGTATLSV